MHDLRVVEYHGNSRRRADPYPGVVDPPGNWGRAVDPDPPLCVCGLYEGSVSGENFGTLPLTLVAQNRATWKHLPASFTETTRQGRSSRVFLRS